MTRRASARLPTAHGDFEVVGYDAGDGTEVVALVSGDVSGASAVLVRLHSECLTGDVLESLRCDCRDQLTRAMARVGAEGGIVVYVRGHEGRGIGLMAKLEAYALQDRGFDTVEANEELGFEPDLRDYANAAAVLRDLAVESIRLLTNNPKKAQSLEEAGIDVVEVLPLVIEPTEQNRGYLSVKASKLGHQIDGG